jgi:hypothetical protein
VLGAAAATVIAAATAAKGGIKIGAAYVERAPTSGRADSNSSYGRRWDADMAGGARSKAEQEESRAGGWGTGSAVLVMDILGSGGGC